MDLKAKYPYLTAWVGFIALNALAGLILGLVLDLFLESVSASSIGSSLTKLVAQMIVGFFVFKFVIQRNILPYVQKKADTETL